MFIIFVLAVICVSVAVIFLQRGSDSLLPETSSAVRIGGQSIRVDVAATSATREQGLSGRERLGDGEGMLFVFPSDGKYAFWMKDMYFPIDIVWISSSSNIVDIRESVPPESYPAIFTPRREARYVVELPAGFVEEYGVHIGDSVELPEVERELSTPKMHELLEM